MNIQDFVHEYQVYMHQVFNSPKKLEMSQITDVFTAQVPRTYYSGTNVIVHSVQMQYKYVE